MAHGQGFAASATAERDQATDRVSAGGYLRLLTSWRPEAIRTQTVVLRAREPVPDVTAHEWRLPHTRINVPGDHFTMLTGHAATLADAISRWPDRPERNERP